MFKPKIVYPQKNNVKYKNKQVKWYIKSSKAQLDFTKDQEVWGQNKFSKEWEEAIVEKLKQLRSYLVKKKVKIDS